MGPKIEISWKITITKSYTNVTREAIAKIFSSVPSTNFKMIEKNSYQSSDHEVRDVGKKKHPDDNDCTKAVLVALLEWIQ